ncbi:uncharacterized protein LOC116307775 isoform X2 [Actinia tenebrosa]|nr:uncharacterized protein LOC116307775 isoform X2 [Actinia tenebrosa]XP_031573981.1 uncharacterized protein LOC116307775 isoform X2 [Actinia tenebrosa]XP_031573989.1 uncharacterized protein LOC116307775 isoform X2 [Actinia tenebrosa]
MPTLIMESSPKFITCPDCGERYDNARKRRLIDNCGHPRCYSCLFVDKPCPLCEKLPKQRPRSTSNVKTESENPDKSEQTGNLKQSKEYGVGSHPNLSNLKEMHKDRSATLPPSFRRDSHFRSLHRYEPHNSSSENLSTSRRSPSPPSQRPKSMPPSYHKSLENLHEQFWKSVQLAERKWSTAKTNKKKDSKETSAEEEKSNTVRSPVSPPPPPEIIDCPAPDVVRLPVPSSALPRSPRVLYHHMTAEERMNELRHEISRKAQERKEARPRSCSDILQPQSLKDIKNDAFDLRTTATTRPQSWSHNQFPSTTAQGIPCGYRSTSSLSERSFDSRNSTCSSPPNSWSPMLYRSSSPHNYSSDKSSDVSSINLSDTCSVSSGDSDSLHSGVRSPSSKNERGFNIPRPHSALENYSGGSSPSQTPRRFPVNPLSNVTYWVVDTGKKPLEVHQGLQETNLDEAIRRRPSNDGSAHAQTHWNGQTKLLPAAVVNVRTGVNTL